MKSHIRVALFLVSITLLLWGIGFSQNRKNFYTMSRGNYFFENSRNNINLQSIIVDFGNEQKITLELQSGIWRIKEADDYFASPSEANALLKFISDTIIYRADKLNEADKQKHLNNTFKITCLDNNGSVLEFAEIAPKTDNNRYHYALLNNNSYLYQLKGKISPSFILMDWVQMPFLQIHADSIKRIKANNFEVYRRYSEEPLKSVENDEPIIHIGHILNNIRVLNAEEIKHITHFHPSSFQKVQHYEITLFNGLIYVMNLYKNNNSYWVNIRLDKENTASKDITLFIKQKQILYDGWFFKINFDKGSVISNFTL